MGFWGGLFGRKRVATKGGPANIQMDKTVTYEQTLEMMKQMSPEQMQMMMQQNMKDCVCPKCPTWKGTGESKVLFCRMGKSDIIKEQRGCNCPECPVQKRQGLRWDYYCTRGSGMGLVAQEKGTAM